MQRKGGGPPLSATLGPLPKAPEIALKGQGAVNGGPCNKVCHFIQQQQQVLMLLLQLLLLQVNGGTGLGGASPSIAKFRCTDSSTSRLHAPLLLLLEHHQQNQKGAVHLL